MIYFISRHTGAKEWIMEKGIVINKFIEHLNILDLEAGDTVIGSLPINIIANLTQKNIKYIHIELNVNIDQRGKELTKGDLNNLNAKLVTYTAHKEYEIF